MSIVASQVVHEKNKAGGKGTVIYKHLLSEAEMGKANKLFAEITLPPGTSIGYHEHHETSETYYILKGTALYDDNRRSIITMHEGETSFCPDGEGHAIENASTEEDLVIMALIAYTV